MRWWLLLIIIFSGINASANMTSDFDVDLGYTGLSVQAGTTYSRTIESMSCLELNYNLNVSSFNSAINMSFFEMASSDLGSLPFVRGALGVRVYPLGLNGLRQIIDNGVSGRVWKPSPFISMGIGMTSVSIEDKEKAGSPFFNAVAIDMAPRIGVEIPIAVDWLLIGQFGYLMSLDSMSGDTPETRIHYSGMMMQAGLKINSF